MSAEINCPTCGTLLAITEEGKCACPHCGQTIQVTEEKLPEDSPFSPPEKSPVIARIKTRANNGLGWWTTVRVFAWTFLIIPAGLMAFALAASLIVPFIASWRMPFSERIDTLGFCLIGAGIVSIILVFLAMGIGFLKWASTSQYPLVCNVCGNLTNKHAKRCSTCAVEFQEVPRI